MGTSSDRSDFLKAFNVSRETIESLDIYAELLVKWQKRINVVGPSTIDTLWMRHFGDSLELLNHVPSPVSRWMDIGSGAGFPGMVIAVDGIHKDMSVHVVESNAKKCAFMREVARQTKAPATIHNCRIEAIDSQAIQEISPEVISARALAPLDLLLELAEIPLQQGAIGIFPRGQNVEEELTACRKYWNIEAKIEPRAFDLPGQILVVRQCERL